MSDDDLIAAMFDRDPAIARVAKRLYPSSPDRDRP